MKFSVIVPVYNVEKYLEICVDSVIKQTYQDFELILVDDGSTDRSADICNQLENNYPDHIKVIHKVNEGQLLTRIRGVENAQGDYVIFLDADDLLREDALEIINNRLQNTDVDILFHDYSRLEDYSVPNIIYPFEDGCLFDWENKVVLYHILINSTKLNSVWAKAFRRELFNDIKFDSDKYGMIRMGEDLIQNLPLFTKAKSVVFLKEILHYYRPNEGSISHKYSAHLYDSYKIKYNDFSRYIEEWKIDSDLAHKELNMRILKEMVRVIANLRRTDKSERRKKLIEICNDEWFRNLYKNTPKNELSIKARVALMLVYIKAIPILVHML